MTDTKSWWQSRTVWVNVVQLTVLLLGFLIAIPTVLAAAGGLQGIAHAPAVPPTKASVPRVAK